MRITISVMIYLICLVSILNIAVSTAKTGNITGVISDKKTGETIVGASVVVEGSSTGTAANLDGKFY